MSGLLQSIRARGFAVRPLSLAAQGVLGPALRSWEAQGQFRFPPVSEHPPGIEDWPAQYQRAFDEHMTIATGAFADILGELERSEGLPQRLRALRSSLTPPPGASSCPHHAAALRSKFSTSFINFFNYRHGFLAPHRDRCLITVVYTLVHVRSLHAPRCPRSFARSPRRSLLR